MSTIRHPETGFFIDVPDICMTLVTVATTLLGAALLAQEAPSNAPGNEEYRGQTASRLEIRKLRKQFDTLYSNVIHARDDDLRSEDNLKKQVADNNLRDVDGAAAKMLDGAIEYSHLALRLDWLESRLSNFIEVGVT